MSNIFTYNNPDYHVRANSSAGGLFSTLAERIIADKGVVYGAGFNKDWSVGHRRIDNIELISNLRGSKYVFSDICQSLEQLDNDIKAHRKILFCGTPCQVATVRKRFGANDNLLLVEVVCHGAPEPKFWKSYLDELLLMNRKTRQDITSICFRDKTEGWKNYSMRIDFNDGTKFIQSHRENIYIQAFVYDYTLRNGCTKCHFKNPNSRADISIGDFWGIETLVPEIDNNLGTTIAIGNTDMGLRILNPIAKHIDLKITELAKFNPAIIFAPGTPKNKSEFLTKYINEGFHIASKSVLEPIFRSRKRHRSLLDRIRAVLLRILSSIKQR